MLTSGSSIVVWYHYHPWICHSAPANIAVDACIPEQALMAPLRDEAAETSSSAPCRLANRKISASAPSSAYCGDCAHGTQKGAKAQQGREDKKGCIVHLGYRRHKFRPPPYLLELQGFV